MNYSALAIDNRARSDLGSVRRSIWDLGTKKSGLREKLWDCLWDCDGRTDDDVALLSSQGTAVKTNDTANNNHIQFGEK